MSYKRLRNFSVWLDLMSNSSNDFTLSFLRSLESIVPPLIELVLCYCFLLKVCFLFLERYFVADVIKSRDAQVVDPYMDRHQVSIH